LSDRSALLLPLRVAELPDLNRGELGTERFRIEEIFLDGIKVKARRRALKQTKIDAIADSMQRIGLQTPITVSETEDGDLRLVAGWHRHAAAKSLNWEKIFCHIVRMDDLSRQLWEIDENLCRAELTELEHSEHLAARKQIYEQLHPETRQHVSGALAANAVMRRGDTKDNLSAASFTADTASKTGLDERAIRRSIHRSEHISPEVRDAIRDMPEIADKGVELDALAKMSPERQAAAVATVKSGAAPNVRAVLRPTGRALLPPDKKRSLRIPCDPKKAAAYLIRKWPRADLEVMHNALGRHLNRLN
jgi:ParB-like chromosome segregation protein Spo0J